MEILCNPFERYESDEYDVNEIYKWFVDNNIVEKVNANRHMFIWGSRGSGKSMLIRFFEPYCQVRKHGGWDNFVEDSGTFIGIYCSIPRGLFCDENITVERYLFEILSLHMFNMLITERVILTYITQLKEFSCPQINETDFVNAVVRLITNSDDEIGMQSFEELLNLISREKVLVIKYLQLNKLRNIHYEGAVTSYHDYLLPLIQLFQKLLGIKKGISIMLDDVGFMPSFMHRQINTWISNRNHSYLSIKIATDVYSYSDFTTSDGMLIQKINDYDEIFLDGSDAQIKDIGSVYFEKVGNKRLEFSSLKSKDIRVLFPENQLQKQLKEEAKKEVGEKLANSDSKIKDKDRYIARNSVKVFYKMLSQRGLNRDYAGFENIANLSQGNIRKFLKLAHLIFHESVKGDANFDCNDEFYSVPVAIQNRTIIDFSKKEFDEIRQYKPGYEQVELNRLQILLASICELFTIRLKSSDSFQSEAAVISFGIKDEGNLSNEEKNVLRLATELGYLIPKTYRDKRGVSRMTIYTINKFLIPIYYLDPGLNSGRILLERESFKDAIYDTKLFLRGYASKVSKKDTRQISLDSILKEEVEYEMDEN